MYGLRARTARFGELPVHFTCRSTYPQSTAVLEHFLHSGLSVAETDFRGRTLVHCCVLPPVYLVTAGYGRYSFSTDKLELLSKHALAKLKESKAQQQEERPITLCAVAAALCVNQHTALSDMSDTALHIAARNHCRSAVRWLLTHGASPFECNADGYTARELAVDPVIRQMLDVAHRWHTQAHRLQRKLGAYVCLCCAVCRSF